MSPPLAYVEQPEWYYDLGLPDKLVATATNPRDRAFISLLGKDFIRVSEEIQIKLSDIDYEKEALSIINLREQIRIICPYCAERLAKKYRFCPTCGNNVTQVLGEKNEQLYQRIIPINGNSLGLIQEYLEWRHRFPYEGELLFPFSRQRGWQIVERLGRRIGVKGLHPESLRHLLAARWVNKGLDVRKLRFLMGHADTAKHPPSFSFEQLKSECQKLWRT
jgi:site-specific recombinase XerD